MKIIKITAIWCGGCLVMKKTWKEIKQQYKNIEIIDYDYDMNEQEIKQYNVGKILPVTIFIKDNKEVARLNGEKTKTEIIQAIESMM